MAKRSRACNCLFSNYHSSYKGMKHRLISLYRGTHKHENNNLLIEIHESKYLKRLYVAICLVYYRSPGLFWVHSLQKFLYVFVVHCSEIQMMQRLYILSDFYNTWVIRMLINNFGKAISRLKIVRNNIFKTDIHGNMTEKIIKNITDFPLICYDVIIFFKYDILTRGLFKGKRGLDDFPKLLILCPASPSQRSLKYVARDFL